MYLQELVEVAIGLVFAWLMLSIAVLQIQELIVSMTNKRAKDLYSAIEKMFDDPDALKNFYDHSLIQTLKVPPNGLDVWFRKKVRNQETEPKNPSYIPAESFARALFDIVTKAGTSNSPIAQTFTNLRTQVESLKAGDQKTANALISYLVNLSQIHAGTQIDQLKSSVRQEMLEKLTELEKVGTDNQGQQPLAAIAGELKGYVNGNQADELAALLRTSEPYLDQVKRGALTLGGKQLGEALSSLLAGVEEYATDTDKALAIGRKNVEEWFNNAMDRTSGLYKRWAQYWAFAIGLILAASFNIDSIHIANTLWKTPELRAASADYIQGYVQKETQKENFDISKVDLKPISQQLQQISYPIGWNVDLPKNPVEWIFKFIGFIITAGAAMQGAPFWFDTLKKLVNVRSSGANPAEKQATTPTEREKV